MTEREYYDKLAEFHQRNLKRSLIPKEDFSNKEFFDFMQEQRDFMLEYQKQKQSEAEAQKQIEEALYKAAEQALADLLKGGLNGNINIKL